MYKNRKKVNNLIKEIENTRKYDSSCTISGISKYTDNIICELADESNLEYEIAAEVLINIGAMYIEEFSKE